MSTRLKESSSSGGGGGGETSNTKGVHTHGGRYVQYNVYGNLFEVSSKYVPPIRPIARGAYGIVCAAVNAETHKQVAIKKIGNAFDNIIDAKRTLREIKLLRHMEHENVIAIKDLIRPPKMETFNDVYIVYELMDTDLHRTIRSDQKLTDDHCQYFLYQLLRGLKYVHSANVLHRDLKPSNLLLNSNCDLKIGDFGLARTTSETDFMTEYVVTRWYRAPELLLNCTEYTAAIDIWSVGCILGEIMTREPLFPGKDYVHQLRLITELIGSPDEASLGFLRSDNARRYVRQLPQCRKQQFATRFPNMSRGAIDLLEKMLVFDPNKRITGMRKDFKLSRTALFPVQPFKKISKWQCFCICLQLMRHFVTHICHLFTISMTSQSAPGLSALILIIHHALKSTLKISSGRNRSSTIQIQSLRSMLRLCCSNLIVNNFFLI
ncbi:hypothetical protein Ddye_002712 [Dipteronia dyeriana]|uniref:mitogen-activated protein kinase n=1 Tax=Dipteronia dyeriana TaxID=168575 RepID=A0AAE0CV91_9ROSI|nr:hypothetical protein Ddye_002712 [Dipteronia dyeriana]